MSDSNNTMVRGKQKSTNISKIYSRAVIEVQIIKWPSWEKTKTTNEAQNTTQKTKNRETWTVLNIGCGLRWSGWVNPSCSNSGTCRVTLVTNPLIGHKWGQDGIVITTNGTWYHVVISDTDILNISVVICDTDIP